MADWYSDKEKQQVREARQLPCCEDFYEVLRADYLKGEHDGVIAPSEIGYFCELFNVVLDDGAREFFRRNEAAWYRARCDAERGGRDSDGRNDTLGTLMRLQFD